MEVDWKQVWADLVPRLTLLAASRLSRLSWRGAASGAPSMADAEDFVIEAIAKTMEGKRIWNRAACSLFDHLAGVIISDIGHVARSSDNQRTREPPGDIQCDRADPAPDPGVAAQESFELKRMLDHLHICDPMVGRLAELILVYDLSGTVELSERLGVSAAEVRNLRKRMKRAVHKYLAEEGE